MSSQTYRPPSHRAEGSSWRSSGQKPSSQPRSWNQTSGTSERRGIKPDDRPRNRVQDSDPPSREGKLPQTHTGNRYTTLTEPVVPTQGDFPALPASSAGKNAWSGVVTAMASKHTQELREAQAEKDRLTAQEQAKAEADYYNRCALTHVAHRPTVNIKRSVDDEPLPPEVDNQTPLDDGEYLNDYGNSDRDYNDEEEDHYQDDY